MASKMFATRLSLDTIDLIQNYAKERGQSQNEALTHLIGDALDMKGREGLETRLNAANALIAEQERRLRKATGNATPKRKRLSLGVSLAEAAAVDHAARRAGKTRGEIIRMRLFDGTGKVAPPAHVPRLSASATTVRPALPA